MSASTPIETSGMNLEGWCVLAMSGLFGLFLFGVWWELRCNLRSISTQAQKRERAIARLESEAAVARHLAREAASQRVAALRAMQLQPAPAPVLATPATAGAARREEPAALGLESIGRILERLAQAAPPVEEEVPAFNAARPALNMVRGGRGSEGEEGEGSIALGAASHRGGAERGARGGARDGVKSSAIGSGAIGSNALLASR